MGAQIGPKDDPHRFDIARPEVLEAVTGIKPEEGKFTFLNGVGYKSLQRLVPVDANGGIRVALFPGELKPHAQYLYSDHRAEAFVRTALEGEWVVECNPHLAFFQAPVHQRLYLDPVIDLDQYVELWEGPGGERIGGYWEKELRTSLWPWIKAQGCATPADDPVFGDFLQLLGGKRQSHLRPSLRAERVWPAERVVIADIRAEINRVLDAIGEPSLPVGR